MTSPGQLRPYQVEAVDAGVAGLRAGGRGQIQAACGSGKTIIAIRIAEDVCPERGLVVVLCPTLDLVAQVLSDWQLRARRSFTAVAVASDETVAGEVEARAALPVPVTTEPDEIRRQVTTAQRSSLRLVVGTHRSAGRIGEALIALDEPAALLIVDEAHHTAGSAGKHGALVHDDNRLPATRRLYLTATPRIIMRSEGRRGGDAVLTMDDPAVFGPALYQYPFSRGIEEGWLDDYRLVVTGVTRREILQLLRDKGREHGSAVGPSPLIAAVQVALGRAAQEWGLRRVIAFAPRIVDAAEFAQSLPGTLHQAMPDFAAPLHSDYVSGLHSVEQRALKKDRLRHPPEGGWTVLANSRVLGEGVDMPAVDAIVFTAPKRSVIDTVQAVGRAMRPHPDGRGTATVVVPILLPDDQVDPAAYYDHVGASPEWDVLWHVVRALRAHDDLLAADLDFRRAAGGDYAQEPPSRIVFRMPEELSGPRWLSAITAKLVDTTTSPWWEGLAAARRYHAGVGDLDVPPDYVDDEGFALGRWIPAQRHHRRRGFLAPERERELAELGISWDPRETLWKDGLAAAAAFTGQHGHLDVAAAHVTPSGFALGSWMVTRRREQRQGELGADRDDALRALDPLWDQPKLSRGIVAARRFHARHQHLDVPARHREADIDLGEWLRGCRHDHAAGTLPAQVDHELEQLGVRWAVRSSSWDRHLAAAGQFHAEHGHLNVPPGFRVGELKLGEWLMKRRYDRQRNQLSPDRVAALEALGVEWESQSERIWQTGLTALRAFHAEHGHVRVPAGYRTDTIDLVAWIETRRQDHRGGTLAAERAAALEALGVEWNPRGTRRAEGLAAAGDYYREHGNLRAPQSYRTPDGFRLGAWLHSRRKRFRAGTLDSEQAEALNQIDRGWAQHQRSPKSRPPTTG